jgi:hypothetical protein
MTLLAYVMAFFVASGSLATKGWKARPKHFVAIQPGNSQFLQVSEHFRRGIPFLSRLRPPFEFFLADVWSERLPFGEVNQGNKPTENSPRGIAKFDRLNGFVKLG